MRDRDMFTPALIRAREARGFALLMIVGMLGLPSPTRIGATLKPDTAIAKLQQGNPHELQILWSAWTTGEIIARTIVTRTIGRLSAKGLMLEGQWTCCDLDELLPVLKTEIEDRRAPTFSDADLAAMLSAKLNAQADKFARGIL